MAKEIASIDITTSEDLLRLVEDVRRTGKARVLRRGDQGDAVMAVPNQLRARGQDTPVDSDFGSVTELALRTFQRGRGVVEDSVAGPKTRSSLLATGQ